MHAEAIQAHLDDDRRRLRAALMSALDVPMRGITQRFRTAAQATVEAARAEWRSHVVEPTAGDQAGASTIDNYIRGAHGLTWGDADIPDRGNQAYRRNGDFAWCGAFAAHCLGLAGLNKHMRRKTLPSTYRLQRDIGETHRAVELADLQPGDVLVVDDVRNGKRWGTHITLVEAVDYEAGLAYTIEGNARGLLPDGTVGEGVVRRTRVLDDAGLGGVCPVSGLKQTARTHSAYRFQSHDFTTASIGAWPYVGPDSARSLVEVVR